ASTHHSGLVVGEVTNINDPNKAGRAKVRYPGLDQSTESNWARILVPGGGNSRGSVSIPEVGDEVLIGFEHGDPRQPVVMGGLFGSKNQIPLWTVKDGKVAARRTTSRLGHVFEMSDGESNAEQYVLVQLAGGDNLLKITKADTTLQVPSGNPVTIKSGSTEISMSKQGDITLKAPNITISADQSVKISGMQINVSANSELQMQGQSQASLKGAMLQLQGEATAALKGGIVQIN
ncbi:MAG TPA: phage baseplate assembly protein V, partial [Acidimicrobiales bacterium]|nr:phage baseplate assembly protein V [Acidimicrobiales bacterium]